MLKRRLVFFALLAAACAVVPAYSSAQEKKASSKAAAKETYRKLAEGVETTIPIDWDATETVSIHDLVDVINGLPAADWNPHHFPKSFTLLEKSKQVPVRRTIWNLEFTFKPLRMIRVDVPRGDGKSDRKLIWYMVFRVTNKGEQLVPRERQEGEKVDVATDKEGVAAELEFLPKSVAIDRKNEVVLAFDPQAKPRTQLRFFPKFVLECPRLKPAKAYTDHVLPAVIPVIQEREDKNRKLLDTVNIGRKGIEVSTPRVDNSVWGVATWENVDPTADIFSIYIQGLTNAFRWQDKPEAVQAGSPLATGRTYSEKTLKLNFWRPSDEFNQREEEIRYGQPGQVDYEWVWR